MHMFLNCIVMEEKIIRQEVKRRHQSKANIIDGRRPRGRYMWIRGDGEERNEWREDKL